MASRLRLLPLLALVALAIGARLGSCRVSSSTSTPCGGISNVDAKPPSFGGLAEAEIEGRRACCEACQALKGCLGWKWERGSGKCLLQNAAAFYRESESRHAGSDSDLAVEPTKVLDGDPAAKVLVPRISFGCEGSFGTELIGGTFNDPEKLILEAWEDCCRECSNLPECFAWSWDGGTKQCALKNDSIMGMAQDDAFVSTRMQSVAVERIASGGDASSCAFERDAEFEGLFVGQGLVPDAQACCGLCRDSEAGCFAWTWDEASGACSFGKRVGRMKAARGRHSGFVR